MSIRRSLAGLLRGMLLSIAFLPAVWSGAAAAANLSARNMVDFALQPLQTVQAVPPLVMLVMSMDHQYFQKAYNDYTDLNNDGTVDRTYADNIEYYGYFHAERCYQYSDSTKTFEPKAVATGTNKHYCTDSSDAYWSGNFLNWATMSRMDIVRKVLYGGQRGTDTATETVLLRAYLPTDAHSFAKYYNGTDIAALTPYNSLKSDTLNGGNNNGVDDSDEGISICNTSYAASGQASQTTTVPPLMRVVKGNYSLWSANERWQCTWSNESGSNSNSNNSAKSGLNANSNDPDSASVALTTPGGSVRDHEVRVKVCVSSLFDSARNLENCSNYGGNLKPEGLLQKYSADGVMKFGLLTGSYQKNISGGVLRKRVSDLADEVDFSNGTFKTLASSTPGIIKTLNAVRIWGYGYNDGTYMTGGGAGDNCSFQLTDILASGGGPGEGKCASWGNPMSEIYLEAVRYFASSTRSPTTDFNADDSGYISGLTKDTDWTLPITSSNACASLNAIVFNASVSSYDDDQTITSGAGLTTSSSGAALTKAVGDGESITGNSYFIGKNGTVNDEFCSAKAISGANGLGDAYGLCPEAPTVRGSFHMAGLAHWAHTNDMSSALGGEQKLRTFAVSLQTSTPVIRVPVGGGKFVSILPAYRLRAGGNNTTESSNNPSKDGGGALVDFKIVRPHTEVTSATNLTPASGTGFFNAEFYVNWEDSEQGGDYDQDMWGTIEYLVNTNVSPATIKITTQTVAQSTVTGQLFGFITSGTTQDGFHAYSGILSANYHASVGTDPTGVKSCKTCRALSEGTFTDGELTGLTIAGGGAGSGAGFVMSQAVTILGNTSGASSAKGTVASVAAGGKVTAITRTSNGNNYVNGETLTITSATSTTPATATATASAIVNQIGEQSHTFTASTGSANLLQSPLFYAAKWGGFDDLNGTNTPDSAAEWDSDSNGLPDGFFLVTNPGELESTLRGVFNVILDRIAAGTAAAVVANEQKGNGALFQALYDPQKKDQNGRSVSWIGTLQALFVDSFGLIREDGDGDGQIDNYATDKVVSVKFDDSTTTPDAERRTQVIRYTPVAPDPNNPDPSDPAQFTASAPADLSSLKTVWNAREKLSSLSNSTIRTQRTYTSLADTGRYIFTWLDGTDGLAPDNVVAGSEVVDFISSKITDSNYYWLDYFKTAETDKKAGAQRLVDWARGYEDSSSVEFRSRSVDYDGAAGSRTTEVMRLGDIINSTPVSVGPPFAAFDQSALDPSYAIFREQYKSRRQMVYVGANDGMIHAFNGGFFNADLKKFELKPSSTSTVTQHPLGSEIWAYVPKNALPQLQWMAQPDYTHVYTMDLPVRVFDVKIFNPDATHPKGWGTILVAGMRLGGGTDTSGISVDVGADGLTTNNVKTKSAYVVLDITDPEAPPTLLAELSPPNQQFTTSLPQVVAVGDPSGLTAGKWFLVFGSGPTELTTAQYLNSSAVSSGNANVFIYDLGSVRGATTASPASPARTLTIPQTNVFVGDPGSADFDIDMKDEAFYVGSVGKSVPPGTAASTITRGSLFRVLVNENADPSTWTGPTAILSDLNQPFISQPSVTVDSKLRRWVLAGTGRLLSTADKETQDQQALYGILDPVFSGLSVPTTVSNLVDVSSAQVFSTNTVTGVTLASGSDTNSDGAISTQELRDAVVTAGGWRKNIRITASLPSERSTNRLSIFGGILFGSLFTPSTDLCGADGTSRLVGLDFTTGAASLLGVFPCATCTGPTVPLLESISLGGGYSSSASIHLGEQTIEGRVTVVTQDSRGELEANKLNTGSGDPASEISWREYRGQ